MDVDIYCLFFMGCGFNNLGVNNKMTKDEALKMAIVVMQRYLTETPLGNQPHMIAHKAEEAIQACNKALGERNGN
jgi:hypothetical protein